MATTLTDRQREVLTFLREYRKANGFPPTIREIATHFGVYHNAVVGHVAVLERKGLLRRCAGVCRGIFLCGPTDQPDAGDCGNERRQAESPRGELR